MKVYKVYLRGALRGYFYTKSEAIKFAKELASEVAQSYISTEVQEYAAGDVISLYVKSTLE